MLAKHEGSGRRWQADQILAAMQRAAKELGTFPVLTETAFAAHTRIGRQTVRRHFASWAHACALADLQTRRAPSARDVPLEVLFHNLQTVHAALGKLPRQQDMQRSRYKASVYRRRFHGGWNTVIEAYWDWKQAGGHPAAAQAQPLTLPPQRQRPPQPQGMSSRAHHDTYGAPLHFRGMQNAPTNRDEVLFLFSKVHTELGYVVDHIRPGSYPDCEARCLIPGTPPYKKCWIEFEWHSAGFQTHLAREEPCDLVVCGEHDWPACPVPVLSLHDALRTLSAT